MKKMALLLTLVLVPTMVCHASKDEIGVTDSEIADGKHGGHGHHDHHDDHHHQRANYVPYYYPPIYFQPEIRPAAPVYYQPIQIYNPPSETLYNTPPTIPDYNTQGPLRVSGLNKSICSAIENLEHLQMFVEETETVSKQERKVIVKKLLIEPYAFGMTKDRNPIFRGHIVEQKIVKEVVVKYPDDLFTENKNNSQLAEKSDNLSNADKSTNIDIRNIIQIQVLINSHFVPPKDFEGIKDDNIEIICQLPIAEKDKLIVK